MQREIRSAYPLDDNQPVGTSVPFMPQARPWNIRSSTQRPLDEHESGEVFAANSHPAAQKPILLPISRKTASVTENQGFVEQPKFIKQEADFRKAGLPLRGTNLLAGSHVRADIIVDLNESRRGPRPPKDEDNLTKPAILWLVLGTFVFPLFLLCGARYVRSYNVIARRVGYVSLFIFVVYLLAGLVLFVQYYTAMYSSGWDGSDPICIRYMQGQGANYLDNPLGSAYSIYGISSLGIGPITNLSIYQVSCGFVMQVPVTVPSNGAPYQVMYVRVNTPSTVGDDFGVYVRNRVEGQVNRFMDPAPALSWFQYADPYISNPWSSDSGRTDRPPCQLDMCSGVYVKSTPAIGGIRYDVQVLLAGYQYQMLVGVFAKDSGALSRPFCVDTCGVPYVKDASNNWVNPCAGIDLLSCPAAASCIFALTRSNCLGII